jgi:hypothetical protein
LPSFGTARGGWCGTAAATVADVTDPAAAVTAAAKQTNVRRVTRHLASSLGPCDWAQGPAAADDHDELSEPEGE